MAASVPRVLRQTVGTRKPHNRRLCKILAVRQTRCRWGYVAPSTRNGIKAATGSDLSFLSKCHNNLHTPEQSIIHTIATAINPTYILTASPSIQGTIVEIAEWAHSSQLLQASSPPLSPYAKLTSAYRRICRLLDRQG